MEIGEPTRIHEIEPEKIGIENPEQLPVIEEPHPSEQPEPVEQEEPVKV